MRKLTLILILPGAPLPPTISQRRPMFSRALKPAPEDAAVDCASENICRGC
jgi:hypothetical protein